MHSLPGDIHCLQHGKPGLEVGRGVRADQADPEAGVLIAFRGVFRAPDLELQHSAKDQAKKKEHEKHGGKTAQKALRLKFCVSQHQNHK